MRLSLAAAILLCLTSAPAAAAQACGFGAAALQGVDGVRVHFEQHGTDSVAAYRFDALLSRRIFAAIEQLGLSEYTGISAAPPWSPTLELRAERLRRTLSSDYLVTLRTVENVAVERPRRDGAGLDTLSISACTWSAAASSLAGAPDDLLRLADTVLTRFAADWRSANEE